MILSKVKKTGIDLEKLIEDTIATGNFDRLLVVVPTNRKSLYWRKQIVKDSRNSACPKIFMETLSTLTNKLLSLSVTFNLISDAAASVLIKQSFTEESLEYFNVYSEKIPTGTLDRIKNLISKFKENGITEDEIISEAKTELTGSNIKKALDIAKIYRNYKNKCRKRKFYEIGDVYEELILLGDEALKGNFLKLFPNIENIIFYGFDEFTMPEIEIINMISNICDTYIDFDYYEKNSSIFYHLEAPTKYFEVKGFNKIEDLSSIPFWEFKDLCRKHLFNSFLTKPIDKYVNSIIKIKADDKYKEIEYIAKEIKKILSTTNIPPNRICVAFNLIKPYSSIIRSVFSKYKIPLNLTDRFKLDNSPIAILLINILNIVQNDYYYKDVFNVIDNKIIKRYLGDTKNLIAAAGELKITIGKKNWETLLSESLISYKNDEDYDYYDKIQKELYQDALEKFEKLKKLLEPFEKPLTIDSFLAEMNNLILKLDIHSYLLSNNHDINKKNIAALSKFLEVISEIFILLKSEYQDSKLNLIFYIDNIKTACKWARYNTIGISECGVLATTINEIRGLRFDYLFIGGLFDGSFPTKYQPEIFDKSKFLQKDKTHQTEERYHFYQTLCCWSKGLYLTYPCSEGEKELEESIFFGEFEHVFKITEISDANNYFANKIYSNDEILTFYGLLVRNGEKEIIEKLLTNTNYIIPHERIDKINKVYQIRTGNYLESNEYNGYLLENITNEELKQEVEEYLRSILNKQFSVSQLDEYAKCHFKYFANRVLKLTSFKEPSEEMEVYEKGILVHDILFEFHTYLRDNNISIMGCDDDTFNKITKLLFEIANRFIENSVINLPASFFEREKLIGKDDDVKNSILWRYLLQEREIRMNNNPSFFEVKFGKLSTKQKDSILSTDNPIEIAGIKLRGKIDRIDFDKNLKVFTIIDYKTGKVEIKEDDITDGYSNQLPVYLIAANKLLSDKVDNEIKPYNFMYYRLVYSEKDFGLVTFPNKQDIDNSIKSSEDIMEIAKQNIRKLVCDITEGKFNLISKPEFYNKVCSYCEFKAICRINEVKN